MTELLETLLRFLSYKNPEYYRTKYYAADEADDDEARAEILRELLHDLAAEIT